MSVDADVQEVLHMCRRRGRHADGARLFDSIVALGFEVLPVTLETMQLARAIASDNAELSTRDAVHAGAMKLAGIVEAETRG